MRMHPSTTLAPYPTYVRGSTGAKRLYKEFGMNMSMKLISHQEEGNIVVMILYAPGRDQYHMRKFRADNGVMLVDWVFPTKRAAMAASRK